ncbi:hypothetical protein [Streptomyces sp. NPDC057382]|uniref:hypothetical protein n=1 Tax=unclassified Streptomyces TaxID=2593676 RepID=UPI00362BC79A
MPQQFEYADGAKGGGPQEPPPVYLPQEAAPPAYEAYADPAAAHGWQDAYDTGDPASSAAGTAAGGYADEGLGGADSTRELPAVPPRGRPGAGRGARRKPRRGAMSRPVAVAGAVGAVSVVALVAGFSLTGSSSGGSPDGRGGRTAPTAEDSPAASPAGTDPAATAQAPLAGTPEESGRPSGAASGSASRTASPAPSATATGGASSPAGGGATSAPAEPAPTATSTAPGRFDGKPGRGPGGTKGPK